MRQTSGIVLEVRADAVVVLTREGIFAEVPVGRIRRACAVGETIPLTLDDEWFEATSQKAAAAPASPRRGRSWLLWRWKLAAAAAVALVLLAGGLAGYRALAAPAYEVAIDINPSVWLAVAADDHVRSARADNDDAQAVLAQVDVVGAHVLDAVHDIVTAAHRLGYLGAAGDGGLVVDGDGSVVVISIVPRGRAEPPAAEAIAAILEQAAEETQATFRAGIQLLDGDLATAARRAGLPIGRAALLEELKALGIELPEAEQQAAPLGRLLALAARASLPAVAEADGGPAPAAPESEGPPSSPPDPISPAPGGEGQTATVNETDPAGSGGSASGPGQGTLTDDRSATDGGEGGRRRDGDDGSGEDRAGSVDRRDQPGQALMPGDGRGHDDEPDRDGDGRDRSRRKVERGREREFGLILNLELGRRAQDRKPPALKPEQPKPRRDDDPGRGEAMRKWRSPRGDDDRPGAIRPPGRGRDLPRPDGDAREHDDDD